MTAQFAPKDAETLKTEILADTGLQYEGNEDVIDKLVARGLKDEDFKASLHADKSKHLEGKEALKQKLVKAGLDPETGEKVSKETNTNQGLDFRDIRALQDVPDEDVDEVMEYAKFKGMSIVEAKKSPVIQNLLKSRAEERTTAQATNTAVTRNGSKVSYTDNVLKKLEKQEDMSGDEMAEAAKSVVAAMKTRK